MMFEGDTRKAIEQVAQELDVPAAALLAVAEVESGGRALAKVRGRKEPLIRFEGHYFDRFLRGATRIEARKAGLASPVAGRVSNPRSQKGRWSKLDKAIAINRIAALSSSSWGLGQVMGAHWKWLGYGSVDALVDEARSSIVGQVRLMTRYIEKAGLSEALRTQNWQKFARVYNGPAYAKNRYDVKMAQAFERYSLEKPQKNLPQTAPLESDKLMFGARGAAVKRLQKQLCAVGYAVRSDGQFGLVTDRTVRAFQRDHGLPETGIIGKGETMILAGHDGVLVRQMVRSGVVVKRMVGRNARDGGAKIVGGVKSGAKSFQKRLLSLSRRFA